jgi:RimJ/RimL family protein N-acetyltransferase
MMMEGGVAIESARLILRSWRDGDGEEFARVTNTPEVMEHLGGIEDPAKLAETAKRLAAIEEEHGFTFWAMQRKEDGALLGFCGLKPANVAPLLDEVEIGWRLRRDDWGRGYAREAAEASLAWGWANLAVPRIVAITIPANARSRFLMVRLGMERREDMDFHHPHFPPGHPLRAHITHVAERPS